MNRNLTLASAAAWTALSTLSSAQTAIPYQKPPAAIEQLLDAPATPLVRVSPDRTTLLIEQPATFPSIADVAQPRFRLAGIRFNPRSNGLSTETYAIGLSLQPTSGGKPKPVTGLPAKLKATSTLWSPDSKHIAFVQRSETPADAGLDLYVIDTASAHVHASAWSTSTPSSAAPATGCPTAQASSAKSSPPRAAPPPKPATSPPARTSPKTSARSAPRLPTKTCSPPRTTRTSSSSTPPPNSPSYRSPAPSTTCPSRASSISPAHPPTAASP